MLPPLAIFNLGPWEITFILLLALLLFGGKKLPSLAKDLGTGIKEFKKSLSSASTEDIEPPQPPVTPVQEEPTKKKAGKKS
ncbi:MAG TPA: twin-arginine translocase TatA/TatE family subunit [Leptospiraceae bacterium]|nr:twin-arginine translocase TatA/TatE family subunit [Leptospiraceae bacterium]HMW07460.1 twin-arginine translocase TatA/TatE family subunit [Leptospiraceae bacterium]HMX32223.1 twin-arginine translocase TatA/TatE family subunit [Leptospiraceae bacterium]HMY33039.1 twin-arginine translocase TatA/TatE family subunit [Leptospiraceae bacterium]HMZ63503.1 twin-arginine translocase TatA/TatE family subunit [Leptospiraceae bacterium]